MTKAEMIEQLLQQVASLTATVDAQAESIEESNRIIKELNQTIEELKEKLNKNSKNSSKPPSSDGYKKPTPKSLRKSSGKKMGGQKGHPGAYLSVINEPDKIESHMPSSCEGCPRYDKCKGIACVAQKRHILDVVVTVEVTEHQALEIPACPLHGGKRKGEFPSNVNAPVQYGENLQALVVAFNTVGAVSVKRTHEILSGVFNIPLSTGTISNMVKRCADTITDTMTTIQQKVADSALAHFDETGTRVDGKLQWVHNASNSDYTYLDISSKRGVVGMEQCGVLGKFGGVAVHDCWAPYWNYQDVEHAICCAHLLRELNGVTENHQEQTWAKQFTDLLLEMKKVKEKAVSSGKEKLSYYYLHKFDKRYNELIKLAKEENPQTGSTEKKRGRKKKGKVLALVERLEKYKASVCLFVKRFFVPFDNNQAERDIRMIKVKTKVSGCFRSEDGARNYLKIMSYIGTAHKHGFNAYKAIRNAISGHPEIIFE